MTYPLSPTEFRTKPHGSLTAPDRLRFVLGGFTAERSDVAPVTVSKFNTTGPGLPGYFARRMQKNPLLRAQPTISALYLPHVLTLKAASEAVDGGTLAVFAPSYAAPFQPVTVNAMVEPKTSEEVFQNWGVELNQPSLVTVALSDAYRFNVGDKLLFLGVPYIVQTPPKVYALGMINDHAEFIVQQPNFGTLT